MWRPWPVDSSGVSDVLGSVLLIGITVTSFAGLGMLVSHIPGPPDTVHAQVNLQALPGADGVWGTGDELIQLKHLYGEPIPSKRTSILMTTNGVTTRFAGPDLTFSGSELNAGETWTHTVLLNFNDDVSLGLVTDSGERQDLISSTSQTVGKTYCGVDDTAPTAIFTQVPANVEATTTTNVTVTAVLIDVCSSVDTTNAPSLVYSLGQGSPGIMTHTSGTTFVGTIVQPAAGWADVAGSTLTYQLTGMRDVGGNVGDSALVADLVDPFPPSTFAPATATASPGQFFDLANAQNHTDDGAYGSLVEGYSSAPNLTMTLRADGYAMASNWDNENDAVKGIDELDQHYAKYKLSNEDAYTANLPSPGAQTSTIKGLTVWASGYVKDTLINDGWRITACIPSGCTQMSPVFTAAASPTGAHTFSYEVTGLRPGGGSWAWTDIENLQIRVTPTVVTDGTNGNVHDGEWHLDNAWATILHGPGYEGAVSFTWAPSVAQASTNLLQLRYSAVGEQFSVEVRDPTAPSETWNIRGSPLSASGSMVAWSATLNEDEWNGGAVQARIVSLETSQMAQSTLKLDYIRVTSP